MPPSSILKDCKVFLRQTTRPLYKILPSSGEGFRRIKMRKKSKHAFMAEKYFDVAFNSQYKDLRLRSMVAHTTLPDVIEEGLEPFYVFPVDGFKVLYNKNTPEYSKYMKELDIVDTCIAPVVLPTLFESCYSDDMSEAFESNSDIVIFDISCYYAIRISLVENYQDFIHS